MKENRDYVRKVNDNRIKFITLERLLYNTNQFKEMYKNAKPEDIEYYEFTKDIKSIFRIPYTTCEKWIYDDDSKYVRLISNDDEYFANLQKISDEKYDGKYKFYIDNIEYVLYIREKTLNNILNCLNEQDNMFNVLYKFFPFLSNLSRYYDDTIKEKFVLSQDIHSCLFRCKKLDGDYYEELSKLKTDIEKCKSLYIEIYEYLLSKNCDEYQNDINIILINIFSIIYYEFIISNQYFSSNNKKWLEIIEKNKKFVDEYFDYYYYLGMVLNIIPISNDNIGFYFTIKEMYNIPLFNLERFIYSKI